MTASDIPGPKILFRNRSCSQLLSTRHRAGALSVPVLLFVGYSRLIHAWFFVIIVVGKKVLHLLLQAYSSPLCLQIIGLAGLSTLE